MYFKDKLTVSEISKKINLSISQISRILSKSSLYQQEKSNRKEENRKKHQKQAKEIMRKKNKKQMKEKAIMDKLHRQAAIELSYFSFMSKVALRKNCSSVYYYNSKKKRFELKKDMVYSTDIPSEIKY